MPRLVRAQTVAMHQLPEDKPHDWLDRCGVVPVHGGFDLSRIDRVQPEALYWYRGFDNSKHAFYSRRYVASIFEHLPDGRVFAVDPVTDLAVTACVDNSPGASDVAALSCSTRSMFARNSSCEGRSDGDDSPTTRSRFSRRTTVPEANCSIARMRSSDSSRGPRSSLQSLTRPMKSRSHRKMAFSAPAHREATVSDRACENDAVFRPRPNRPRSLSARTARGSRLPTVSATIDLAHSCRLRRRQWR